MKVAAARADAFVAAPPKNIRGLLIYGPDLGLVRERAEIAAKAIAGDLSDPFNVVEFTPRALREEPSRLTDEACALSLTGGRRVVRLRDATDSVTSAAMQALESDGEALIIIEAGDLSPRSKIRGLFEKADDAAAIPCYADEGTGLEVLIREALADAGLKPGTGVTSWVAGNLGSDRMVTRMELEKLTLYAANQAEVSLEDAQAVIGDAAAVTLDDVVFAAAGGNLNALAAALARARFEGVTPVSILRSASRHLTRLEEAVAATDAGETADQAMKKLRPPVFFKQKTSFLNQMQRWRAKTLSRARVDLIQAEINCKSTGTPDHALCERVLMRLAVMAGARIPR